MNNKGADQAASAQAGLGLCCSQIRKTGFLATRPKLICNQPLRKYDMSLNPLTVNGLQIAGPLVEPLKSLETFNLVAIL